MTAQPPPISSASSDAASPVVLTPTDVSGDAGPMIAIGDPAVHLSAAQHQALLKSTQLFKPIRRAMGIASFDAFAAGMLAILALPFAIFSIWSALAVVVLATVACVELRGRILLARLNPIAARWLGWNQVFFLSMICVYCAASIAQVLLYPPDLATLKDLQQYMPAGYQNIDFASGLQILTIVLYGLVALTSSVYIGLVALYYFTRRKHILRFVEDAPAWVVALYRMDAGATSRAVRKG